MQQFTIINLYLPCIGKMRKKIRLGNNAETECDRARILPEKRIVGEVIIDSENIADSHDARIEKIQAVLRSGHDLDAKPAIAESDNSDKPDALCGRVLYHRFLAFLRFVRDLKMTTESLVDGIHDSNEHSPMNRSVLDLVDKDIIMNHLVDESVVEHRLIAIHVAVNLDLHVSTLSSETILAI